MRTGAAVPRSAAGAPLSEGLIEMSRKGLGMTVVVDPDERILGCSPTGTCAARSTGRSMCTRQ